MSDAWRAVPVPDDLAPAGPFSSAVIVPAGELVVLSGQGPLDGTRLVGDTIEEQAAYTLARCGALLEAAGSSLADVFKVSVYLTDLGLWARFNEVYRDVMPAPLPARTAVGTELLLGMMVEVDMWAVRRAS